MAEAPAKAPALAATWTRKRWSCRCEDSTRICSLSKVATPCSSSASAPSSVGSFSASTTLPFS
eukprot:535596-Pleurochrysis_carterae.AAC.5